MGQTWLLAGLETTVTWIKVERPTFDLVGVVLGAFSIAGLCAATALLLGALFGVARIRRARQRAALPDQAAFHLR